jgi:hypothetical protein
MRTMSGGVGAGAAEGRRVLVDLLHEAAELEHCLLDAYLYAACSLKSTPQELEEARTAELPPRRAVRVPKTLFVPCGPIRVPPLACISALGGVHLTVRAQVSPSTAGSRADARDSAADRAR